MVRRYDLDNRTRAYVGYPDGHIEIEVDLPFPLSTIKKTARRSLPLEFVINSIPAIKHALKKVKAPTRR